MNCFNLARFRCQPKRLGGDVKDPGSFVQVQPGLDAVLGGFVYRDPMVRASAVTRSPGPVVIHILAS